MCKRAPLLPPSLTTLLVVALFALGGCGREPRHLEDPCKGLTCAEGVCHWSPVAPLCAVGSSSDGGSEAAQRLALPAALTALAASDTPTEGATPSSQAWSYQTFYFSFEAAAGHWYRFTASCPRMEWCATLAADETGLVFAQSDWDLSPRTPQLAFKADHAGRIIVVLTLYPNQSPDSRYSYQLEDFPDDHGETPETATAIEGRDTAFQGTVAFPGDHDVFTLSAQQGERFYVGCLGGAGALQPVSLGVADGQGPLTPLQDIGHPGIYEARVSGPHTVEMHLSEHTGATSAAYRCRFRSLAFDDHGDTPEEATALPSPGAAEGWLEDPSDVDFFTAELSLDRYYWVHCAVGAGGDCQLRVFDPSGAQLMLSFRAQASINPSVSGRFSFEVRGRSVTDYRFEVSELGADDHGDTPASATLVPAETGTVRGQLEQDGDVDVFAFEASAGHAYTFACQRDVTTGSPRWSLTLRSADGSLVSPEASSWGDPLLAGAEVPASGRYTVEVRSPDDSFAPGGYSCRVEDRGVDAYGDSAGEATALSVPAEVAGRLEVPSDADVFSFQGEAGHFLSVRWAFPEPPWPNRGAELRLTDSPGTVLLRTEHSDVLSYRLAASGTYLLEARSIGGPSPSSVGDYTLQLEDLGLDDHGDTLATATALTPGVPVEGRDQGTADTDMFSFEAAANTFYRLTCTPTDPTGWCAVYQGSTPLKEDPARPHAFLLEASAAGTLGVAVHAADGYKVLLEAVATDDYGDDRPTATRVARGERVSGTLETFLDEDVFVLSLEAGRTYQLQVVAAFPLDVAVVSGSNLAVLRRGSGPFTPSVSGDVFIEVTHQNTSNPPLGPYQLSVE